MTTIVVHPTTTPAADLPAGMIFDVALVLRAHGLKLQAAADGGHPPVYAMLLTALKQVVDAVPVEYGGRKVAS